MADPHRPRFGESRNRPSRGEIYDGNTKFRVIIPRNVTVPWNTRAGRAHLETAFRPAINQ